MMGLMQQRSTRIPEGELAIDCRALPEVRISSSRGFGLQKMLAGKTPQQAIGLMPVLFSVCGYAHKEAARLALGAALGDQDIALAQEREQRSEQQLMVLVESCRESLLRLMLDCYPAVYGKSAPVDTLSFLGGLCQRFSPALTAFNGQDSRACSRMVAALGDFVRNLLFAGDIEGFTRLNSIPGLLRWCQLSECFAADLLTTVSDMSSCVSGDDANAVFGRGLMSQDLAGIAPVLIGRDAAGFIARPTLNDSPVNTGCLARQQQHPLMKSFSLAPQLALLQLWCARLLDIAAMPEALKGISAGAPANWAFSAHRGLGGRGSGLVDAARGALVHSVELHAGRIHRYGIVAPTEWNFHPQGWVARLLGQIDAPSPALTRQAMLWVIWGADPCVGFQLEVQ
ncbi:nickel-dependent hydrogenase large subunit [Shewanella sp. GXUN23E]|uniref:nickel-dependent hydrogenase large subunit n=1 Tax=Shewanella sp. GXUN23E TaxID=3422498 RepID=UPI003D7CF3D1